MNALHLRRVEEFLSYEEFAVLHGGARPLRTLAS
jgi:hypothetical protein